MKNRYILSLLILNILLVGCGPKIYHENEMFGKGYNAGYTFGYVNNDDKILQSIQYQNANFLKYKMEFGVNKIGAILTNKRNFEHNEIFEKIPKELKQPKPAQIEEMDVFGDIVKDYREKNK